jgi:aryl-alcohol dehydrogenase-like predicted oxidoreductase
MDGRKPALDHYRLLGDSGLRVSPLCLGAMNFGTKWAIGIEESVASGIVDVYAESGGNFIDTANNYNNGESEKILGRLLRGRRNRFVVSTKYSNLTEPQNPNACGNHKKNMVESVHSSLRRLQTDYIDIYWVHVWEFRTPVEEVMRGLDDLVRQGKILYAAVSNAPAWIVSQANTIARFHNETPFIALQAHYNLLERTCEQELIPMARKLNIAVLPWSPLAGGILSGKYSPEDLRNMEKRSSGTPRRIVAGKMGYLGERAAKIVDIVRSISEETCSSCSQVALRWLLKKPGVMAPVIGAGTVDQLKNSIACLELHLSQEQMDRLDEASQGPSTFPRSFYKSEAPRTLNGSCKIEGSEFGMK